VVAGLFALRVSRLKPACFVVWRSWPVQCQRNRFTVSKIRNRPGNFIGFLSPGFFATAFVFKRFDCSSTAESQFRTFFIRRRVEAWQLLIFRIKTAHDQDVGPWMKKMPARSIEQAK
jgi:hypothetical protein